MNTRPIDISDYLALTDLKARYFEAVDSRDWTEVRAVFTDDARFEGFAFDAGIGADGFVAALRNFATGAWSNHFGGSPRFRAHSAHLARGTWSLHDYVTWEPDARPYKGVHIPGQWGIRGYGVYEDEYTRTEQGWQISVCRLIRTRIDPLMGDRPLETAPFAPAHSTTIQR